mmetsp:Transcript_30232/g.52856  ORF Transcript_30232/g.52856 Transcript_30232/m.52856 type:complete len:145 (+) Transcript_30232:2-436(+)
MRQLRLPPTARPWRAASRTLCTRPPADRPTEAEVRKLAEGARLQQRMWDTFVPEGGIRFGDRRFWGLLGIVMALHAINTYREARKPLEPGLPEGGLRRLPDGRVLMLDGSIAKHESGLAHSLHKEPEKKELLLDRAYRMLKGSV